MRIVVRLVVLTAVLALSVVAIAPAAAAPMPALPPPSGAAVTILGVHTVQAGETLDCIGRAYKVDPNAIAQVNGTGSPAAGQKLNIPAVPWYNIPAGTTCTAQFQVPAGWPPPNPSTILGVHTVQQGEWIYCIARAYKVDPMAIAQASGIPGPYTGGWYGHGWKPGPYGCSGYPGSYGCGGCPGSYGGCGGYYPYFAPWNYVVPGQKLNIPAVPWYNIPAGRICVGQFQVPAGWPPPMPAPYPVPAPY
jgi:LysM repeat protein